jgi:hypothetical protein
MISNPIANRQKAKQNKKGNKSTTEKNKHKEIYPFH